VLSSSYNKLHRMATVVRQTNLVPTQPEAADAFIFCLEAAFMAMKRNLCQPKFFTMDALDKQRDGSAGWAATTVLKRAVLQHVHSIVRDMAQVDQATSTQLVDAVLPAFATPIAFLEKFPQADSQAESGPAGVSAEADIGGNDAAQLDKLKEGLNKGGIKLVDFLFSLQDGAYDKSIKWAASQAHPLTAVQESDDANIQDLSKDLREVIRLLSSSQQVVAIEAGAPPPPSLRQLARMRSDPTDMDRAEREKSERAETWTKAQAQRRKFVQFGRLKAGGGTKATTDAIAELFKKSGPVRNFKGVLKESHRAFIVSADLLSESADEPWNKHTAPKEADLGALLDFALQQSGPVDFVFAFDGRHRSSRRQIEDAWQGKTHMAEAFIVFQAGKGHQREYCCASNNREVFYVNFPVARNRLGTKDRYAGLSACGEATTHYTSYSGVPMRGTRDLPKISCTDKEKTCPTSSGSVSPPGHVSEKGVPLFWHESKPVVFWTALLHDFDIQAVFDLTPGSGALASACLSAGCLYFGIIGNEYHLSWLQNVLDRTALCELVKAGTPLYQEDMASSIKEHFADLLDELNRENAADDSDEDSEGQECVNTEACPGWACRAVMAGHGRLTQGPDTHGGICAGLTAQSFPGWVSAMRIHSRIIALRTLSSRLHVAGRSAGVGPPPRLQSPRDAPPANQNPGS